MNLPLTLVSLLLIVLLRPSVALAQDEDAPDPGEDPELPPPPPEDPTAEDLYEEGRAAISRGEYADGIQALEESYDLSERHGVLYEIAGAYEEWDRFQQAIDTLERYRPHAQEVEIAALDAQIESLRDRLDESALEAVEISDTRVTTEKTNTLKWVLVGGGGAMVAGFTTAAVLTWSRGRDLQAAYDEEAYSGTRTLNNASVVLAGSGVAVAAVGIALPAKKASDLKITAAAGPDGGQAAFMGRF